MDTHIRQPAVAGMFYPSDAAELKNLLDSYLDEASDARVDSAPLKALIAPHAGYIYSGPVAAHAYARIVPRSAQIRRVILLGPSHRVPLQGIAASSASHFSTPLGLVAVDQAAVSQLLQLPQVKILDEAHLMEHSLEVQLPFLQVTLEDFAIVPLVVGNASPQQVAEVLELCWGGDETLIVISSDLSHYHPYEAARQRDSTTCKAIEQLQYERIGYEDACGRNPLNGLLYLCQQRGLHIDTLDLRNSGDTAGPKDRVVGYGAWICH